MSRGSTVSGAWDAFERVRLATSAHRFGSLAARSGIKPWTVRIRSRCAGHLARSPTGYISAASGLVQEHACRDGRPRDRLHRRHNLGRGGLVGTAGRVCVLRLEVQQRHGRQEHPRDAEHVRRHRHHDQVPVGGRGGHQSEGDELEPKRNHDRHHHDAGAPAGSDHGVGQLAEVVGHEDDAGGLGGHGGALHAHGDADVGRGQRRAVVDPVAHHAHHPRPPPLLDGLELLRRLDARAWRLDDADGRADEAGRLGRVSRQHARGEAQADHGADRLGGVCANAVGHAACGGQPAVEQYPQHRVAGRLPRRNLTRVERQGAGATRTAAAAAAMPVIVTTAAIAAALFKVPMVVPASALAAAAAVTAAMPVIMTASALAAAAAVTAAMPVIVTASAIAAALFKPPLSPPPCPWSCPHPPWPQPPTCPCSRPQLSLDCKCPCACEPPPCSTGPSGACISTPLSGLSPPATPCPDPLSPRSPAARAASFNTLLAMRSDPTCTVTPLTTPRTPMPSRIRKPSTGRGST
eukprot:scaffold3430_cov114-Isochrysis_galbana.AAC.1